jgi:hypothetical protein
VKFALGQAACAATTATRQQVSLAHGRREHSHLADLALSVATPRLYPILLMWPPLHSTGAAYHANHCCAGLLQQLLPQRRDLISVVLLSSASLAGAAPAAAFDLPFFGGPVSPPIPPNTVRDSTLAYEFTYPTVTASGRELPIAVSRKPEKYSSAAPLTVDARQRIVAELVSLQMGVTYAVFVGPASGALQDVPPSEWTAPLVASTVLTDRSAVRCCLQPFLFPCLVFARDAMMCFLFFSLFVAVSSQYL